MVVSAADRAGRERLLRYCARPPFSLERMNVLPDGRIAYALKNPWRTGETHRVMDPIQFIARLAALVPPPRHPLIRFYGCFAPNSSWRGSVVPPPAPADPLLSNTDGPTAHPAPLTRRYINWAELLKRVYDVDALACDCGGRLSFIALITERETARTILQGFRLNPDPPPIALPRAPTFPDVAPPEDPPLHPTAPPQRREPDHFDEPAADCLDEEPPEFPDLPPSDPFDDCFDAPAHDYPDAPAPHDDEPPPPDYFDQPPPDYADAPPPDW